MTEQPDRVRCNQKDPDCEAMPVYRFTWPGRDEAFICEVHALKLRSVASAMGLHLQLITLPNKCV